MREVDRYFRRVVFEKPSTQSSVNSMTRAMRFVMRPSTLALCAMIAAGDLSAQTATWQPSAGHTQILLWPGSAPDSQLVAGPEFLSETGKEELIAGRPYAYERNVSRPTMTVYPAQGKNTGAAVVVFPGGGYQILAMDLEGTEVCDWLTPRGIACVVVKYRVTDVGPYPKSGPYPEAKMALEDAQRAVGLVRFHAADWHINPHKIGVLGFSAGGHLVAAISVHYEKRLYPAADAADAVSCRPDFAVPIYPGHLSLRAAESDARVGTQAIVPRHLSSPDGSVGPFAVNPDLRVTTQTPPTFLVQAADDSVDDVANSLAYYGALKKAGVSAEVHLFARGGHVFGIRRTALSVTGWPELMEAWLREIGMI
jgi:acetyl esterase/lipase